MNTSRKDKIYIYEGLEMSLEEYTELKESIKTRINSLKDIMTVGNKLDTSIEGSPKFNMYKSQIESQLVYLNNKLEQLNQLNNE